MREMVQHTRVAPAARIERLVKFIVGGSQIPYVHSQEVTRIKDAFKTNYAPKKTSKTISFIMLLVCFVGYVNAEDQEKKIVMHADGCLDGRIVVVQKQSGIVYG